MLETVLNPTFQTAKQLMLFVLYLDLETAKSSMRNVTRSYAIDMRKENRLAI